MQLRVFYALHYRYRRGDYEIWKCIAAELGYEVTVVKDATADYSNEETHAALDINIPNYASAMVTTDEIVVSISSVETLG